ncbi:Protein of unknown function [Gryllus bimaculatus]|nr:Protein of unknown function [Gryllus bimaculatus]
MGAARVALWALLCAALAQGALATTPPSSPFVLRKCCALDQILNDNLSACVPLKNATHLSLNIAIIQKENLWWMDAKVRVAPKGKIEKLSALAQNATVLYEERPCEADITSILWTTEASLYMNGSLGMELTRADGGPTEKFVLPPKDYCMDRTTLSGKLYLAFLACPCKHVVCVRKCCDNKRMLTMSEAIAMKQEAHCDGKLPEKFTWIAPFTALTAGSGPGQGNVAYARLRGPFPNTCPSGRMNVVVEMSDKFNSKLLPNGSLLADVTGSPFAVRQFCVDYGKDISKEGYFAYVCAKEDLVQSGPETYDMEELPVPGAVTWSGLASLLATLAVYALLPELRGPVYAKALMCHVLP